MLRSIAKFFGVSESEVSDESTGGLVIILLMLPFRMIWGFIYFMIFAWTTSRSGRSFVLAFPAMIGFVGFIALVWVIGFKGDTKALAVSRGFSKIHSHKENPLYDPEAARFLAKKVVEESPEDPHYKYELGLAYELNEQTELAFEIMNWISPLVEVNSPEAEKGHSYGHLWLATYFSTDKYSDLTEEERESISRQHLELASIADPENVFSTLGLAAKLRADLDDLKLEKEELVADSPEAKQKEIQIKDKRLETIRMLRKGIGLDLVSERQLYASVALVELLQEEDNYEQARIEGLQFINSNIRIARKNADVLPFWISIVKICILIDDFDLGEQFILQGHQLAQNPEVRSNLAQLAAQIEVEKARTFENMDDESEFLAKLNAIAKAIKTDVKVPQGYAEILYYVDGFEDDSDQDYWLRDSILGDGSSSTINNSNLDPRLPGVLHVVVGFRDILRGDKQAGQNHWETANQQFQLAPYAINYLTQVYCAERELDNDRQVELISIAIAMFPQSPNFYITRGKIFMDSEKYSEALEDFHFAEARLPANIALFEAIKNCYEELGNQEKVDEYTEKIDDLTTEQLRDQIATGFSSGRINIEDEEDEDNEEK